MGKQPPWPGEPVSCNAVPIRQDHSVTLARSSPAGSSYKESCLQDTRSEAREDSGFVTPWWFESYDTPRNAKEGMADALLLGWVQKERLP